MKEGRFLWVWVLHGETGGETAACEMQKIPPAFTGHKSVCLARCCAKYPPGGKVPSSTTEIRRAICSLSHHSICVPVFLQIQLDSKKRNCEDFLPLSIRFCRLIVSHELIGIKILLNEEMTGQGRRREGTCAVCFHAKSHMGTYTKC